MADIEIRCCQCPACLAEGDHPQQQHHHRLILLLSRLDEQQRRWLAALEAKRLGHGGDTLVSLITGLHVDTIRRGREELDQNLQDRPADRVRLPGGGRPSAQKKIPPSLPT